MKNKLTCLLCGIVFLFLCSHSLHAQSSLSSGKKAEADKKVIASKLARSSKTSKKQSRKSRLASMKVAPMRNEYYEKRIKEKAREAEEMKKPQYADKMYFGHKRQPKKRAPGKKKFCHECGLLH